MVAGRLEKGKNVARKILGDTSCHVKDLLCSAGAVRVERGLAEVLHIDLFDFVARVQSHDRTCSADHLQLAGLDARAHAAAVLVKRGHCLVVNSRKEGVVLMLELVDDRQQPVDKDRAARPSATVTV